MKAYDIELCGVKRTLPFVKINDELAFASFVIISDTQLICAAAKELAARIEEAGGCDVIVTAEAKGIALANEVNRLLGKDRFIVARKSVKSYMKNVVSHEVHSITTVGKQMLYLDGEEAEMINGKRVCLIDDVISTGESLAAIEALAVKAGGNITARAAVLAEGDAADRTDIIFLQKLPLFKKTGEDEYEPID